MEESKDYMSQASNAAPQKSFHDKFRQLTQHINSFKDCYIKSKCLIAQIEGVFKNDLNQSASDTHFMTDKEKDHLDTFVQKKASVLVIGQTNSGKSSLINELLGSSYLPTSEIPCTSRIVRIIYNEKNSLSVKDWEGNTQIKAVDFKKTIPKAEIAIEDDSKRGDADWTRRIVEVGLNNPLLEGGHLEFVDAPGMSENPVLDGIVQECTHGILQIIIYVIDGNSSLRMQDREFLFSLKSKIRAVPIFFVCNKVDFNETAAKYDRDDDEDESYQDRENQLKVIKEKKMRVFSALVRNHIIEKEIEEVDSCEFFHAVSTKEIRKARRKKTSSDVLDEHNVAFERMKHCFLLFASKSVTLHVSKAASSLASIQQRIFDFYINRQHRGPQKGYMQSIVTKINDKEQKTFEKMKHYIIENEQKIESILTNAAEQSEEKILAQAEDMEFAPIAIADVVHRNEIVNQYKGQIQKMVLLATLNTCVKAATKSIQAVSASVQHQLKMSLDEASKSGGLTGRLVQQQFRYCSTLMSGFDAREYINMAVVKDNSLMTDKYQLLDTPKTFLSDMMSIVKGTKVNKEWKRAIAKDVFDNIDRQKLGRRIIEALLDNLREGHETFQVNLKCATNLIEKADSQSVSQQEVISEYGPVFAEAICQNDALLETLENPDIQLQSRVERQGQRSEVFMCSAGKYNDQAIVAKLLGQNTSNLMHLTIQHAMKRLDKPHPNVIKPLSLVLIDNRITILLPRLKTDLYSALDSRKLRGFSLKNRLIIMKQIVDACTHCRENGLQLIDPRITNVLLDERFQAFLNIAKPRDDSICYPDNLAPFHVFTDPPPLIHTSNQVLQLATKHDVYALGIMGWLLVLGEYTRPPYANRSDVKEIYEAARRQTVPDMNLFPQSATGEELAGIVVACLSNDYSLWELGNTLSTFIENMDSLPKETPV